MGYENFIEKYGNKVLKERLGHAVGDNTSIFLDKIADVTQGGWDGLIKYNPFLSAYRGQRSVKVTIIETDVNDGHDIKVKFPCGNTAVFRENFIGRIIRNNDKYLKSIGLK